MNCKRCNERGQNWPGDPPKCAFATGPLASCENWNCATINAIRDICHEWQNPMPSGVDYQYCEDQKYATIKIDEIDFSECGRRQALALWVSWYKSRGKTDALWILSEDEPPRRPTVEDLEKIILHYSK